MKWDFTMFTLTSTKYIIFVNHWRMNRGLLYVTWSSIMNSKSVATCYWFQIILNFEHMSIEFETRHLLTIFWTSNTNFRLILLDHITYYKTYNAVTICVPQQTGTIVHNRAIEIQHKGFNTVLHSTQCFDVIPDGDFLCGWVGVSTALFVFFNCI